MEGRVSVNNHKSRRIRRYVTFSTMLTVCAWDLVRAQENDVWLDLEVGAKRSDNIARLVDASSPGASDDENVLIGGVAFRILSGTDSLELNVRGSLHRYMYDKGVFDDETLTILNGFANWYIVPQKLNWSLNANHGQQTIDPFQATTPLNSEDITVLATGPQLTLPIGRRNSITASATLTKVDYELSPYGNRRLGGVFGLSRAVSPTSSLSLNLRSNRLEYDVNEIYAPIDQQAAYISYDLKSARNTLSADIGWNQFERAGFEGDGFLGELDLSRQVSPQTTLALNLGSRYSTNGDIFRLGQELDDEFQGTHDLQPSDDVFRYNNIGVSYSTNRDRTRFRFHTSWSEEDYETQNVLDRTLTSANIMVGRDLTRTWSIDLSGNYSERQYENQARTDHDSIFELGTGFKMTSRTSVRLSARHVDRSSNNAENEFEENIYSLMFTFRAFGSR